MLGWYPWDFTLAQLNLLGSHDTPRTVTLFGGVKERLKLAMLYMMTSPGAPCIYYGDEIGLAGGPDPACRAAMPWNRSSWDSSLRDHVRRLTAMRHRHAALRRGTYATLYAARAVYAFARRHKGEDLIVAINTNEHAVEVRVPVPPDVRDGTSLHPLLGEHPATVASGRTSPLPLAALSGGVWQAA
jgi:glycosidase